MGINGKAVAWGVGLAVAAALATTGTVYAATDAPDVETAPTTVEALVPIEDQPKVEWVDGPMSLERAVAKGAFSLPPEIEIKPSNCWQYLENVLGPLGKLDGWVQQGQRASGGAFLQAVIEVPGKDAGELLAQIEDEAVACQDGQLTLEDPETGERRTGTVSFDHRKTTAGVTAAGFGGGWLAEWDESQQFRMTDVSFSGDGHTVLFVMEESGDTGFADQLAMDMYERLVKLG